MLKFEFDNLATGLSWLNALFLAKAADLAYDDLNQIQNHIINDLGFFKYKPFDNKDTQAFLCANDEIIIVAFQGTTSIDDWLTDLKIKLVPSPSKVGCVHLGFNEAIGYVWQDLRQTILDSRSNNQSLWITGHSLGGALATLATDRLTDEGIKVNGLYTFGQPRVGDEAFANNFDSEMKKYTFRFAHDQDAVPDVPTTPQGYRHIGTEYFFDSKGSLYIDEIGLHKAVSYCDDVASQPSGNISEITGEEHGSFRDHGLGYYLRFIRKNYIKSKDGSETFTDFMNK